jgi:hypothetical protein
MLAGCFALGNDGTTAARLRHDAALKTHHASAQGRDVGDRLGGATKGEGANRAYGNGALRRPSASWRRGGMRFVFFGAAVTRLLGTFYARSRVHIYRGGRGYVQGGVAYFPL